MRLRQSLVLAAILAAALAFAAPAKAELLVSIDKSKQEMTVTVDGSELYVWPVSTGMRGYDTPDGDYKPFRMEKDHFSREWDDAPMPHSIFFTMKGHAIHGTYEAKNLGRPASRGCVRLSRANAATLWALVKENKMANTKVVLAGEIPGGGGTPVARRQRPAREAREYAEGPNYYYYQQRPDPYYQRQPYGYYQQQPYAGRGLYGTRGPFPFVFGW